MKLYDFSHFAAIRKEQNAAKNVVQAVEQLQRPGAVVDLKRAVNTWFSLHQDIMRKVS